MGGIDWGDAPTWVAGAFAAAAAFYARGTMKSQQEQIREQRHFIEEQSANLALERAELQAAADARKASQARQVELTVQLSASEAVPTNGRGSPRYFDSLAAQVTNHSVEPLHDVTVHFGSAQAVDAHEARGISGGSGWWRTGDPLELPVSLLGAGGQLMFDSGPLGADRLETERPVLFFTDNAGVRWSLDEHGSLKELPADSTSA